MKKVLVFLVFLLIVFLIQNLHIVNAATNTSNNIAIFTTSEANILALSTEAPVVAASTQPPLTTIAAVPPAITPASDFSINKIIKAFSNPVQFLGLLGKVNTKVNNALDSATNTQVTEPEPNMVINFLSTFYKTYGLLITSLQKVTKDDIVYISIWGAFITIFMATSALLKDVVLVLLKNKLKNILYSNHATSSIKTTLLNIRNFSFCLALISIPNIVINIIIIKIMHSTKFINYLNEILQIAIIFTITQIFISYIYLLSIRSQDPILLRLCRQIKYFVYSILVFFIIEALLQKETIDNATLSNCVLILFIISIVYHFIKFYQIFKIKFQSHNGFLDLFLAHKTYYILTFLLLVLIATFILIFLSYYATSAIYFSFVKIILIASIFYMLHMVMLNIFEKRIEQKTNKDFKDLTEIYEDIKKATNYLDFSKFWRLFNWSYKSMVYYFAVIWLFNYVTVSNLFDTLIINIIGQTLLLIFFMRLSGAVIIVLIRNKLLSLLKLADTLGVKRIISIIVLGRKPVQYISYIVFFIFLLVILQVPVITLLASTSIITLIFAFGAKDILQNFFNAILFLVEGSFFINDLVEIAGKIGIVEDISLLYVRIRDAEGRVHMIPFSKIDVITNYSKVFSYALINCGVAYNTDVAKVYEVLKAISDDLRSDDKFKDLILDNIEIFGVTDLNDFSINIRARMKTLPGKQALVRVGMYERIHSEFPKNGIDIPFPISTLYLKNPV